MEVKTIENRSLEDFKNIFKKEIKIANMLPAIFIPMVYSLIVKIFS